MTFLNEVKLSLVDNRASSPLHNRADGFIFGGLSFLLIILSFMSVSAGKNFRTFSSKNGLVIQFCDSRLIGLLESYVRRFPSSVKKKSA